MQKYKVSSRRKRQALTRLPLAAAICLAFTSTAFAQEEQQAPQPASTESTQQSAITLDTVTVTAQKRTENLQKVPISMQVLGTQQLQELHVTDFEDYAKLLPSVSFQSFQPGFNLVYMRGVASGGDGNHSGSLPSVGVYLDEQPITTIQGALDVHVYDMERVESLSGPQGTLYGASSQSGTLRLITNKPDPGSFAASYGLELNSVQEGGNGYVAEGMVNVPISDNAAIRLVGWNKHDAGYIDNKFGTRTFPTSGITMDNADRAEDDYNDVDTTGARLALKVDLNDNWTITPTFMAQRQKVNGTFAVDEEVDELGLTHFFPERSEDKWNQAALTVQGKIGNFDVTYAFARLKRDDEIDQDYNDYAFWYDTLAGYGAYFYDDDGVLVNPSQYIQGKDGYTKTSHELRIASPQEDRLRFVAGVFWQEQKHDIEQRYIVDNLASLLSVGGWNDTIWLTEQDRTDRDRAVFGEVSFDLTDRFTLTAGARHFRAHNGLKGFFGFADGYFPLESFIASGAAPYGEAACRALYGDDRSQWVPYEGAPCTVFDKEVKEDDTLGKVNLTWELSDTKMLYATWSEGYRPGGINRRGTLPPYLSDFLTNYELGWKTSWADNRLVFNGAVFQEEWEDFQFSILGANGLTEIRNANQAQIRGLEMDLNWAATYNLRVTGGVGFYDAELTENYCGWTDSNGDPVTVCPPGTVDPDGNVVDGPQAPDGTRLPVTAKFKGNLTGRYMFNIGGFEAFVQGSLMHEGERTSDLRLAERDLLGDLPSYTMFDLSAGIRKNNWALDVYVKNAGDERAQYNRFTVCAESVCGANGVVPEYPNGQVYSTVSQPRTFGVRFSQEL